MVADQIGKLANDSAQSAVNTRELIGKSVSEIAGGNSIASRTAAALKLITDGINHLAESSKNISDMAESQADAMKQLETGVEQISGVVQTNSASAQESSATSEELLAQSESLKALVGQFQLRKEETV